MSEQNQSRGPRVPRRQNTNYTHSAIEERQGFIEQQTGINLKHVSHFSQDPQALAGNIENPIGMTHDGPFV